MFVVLLNYIKPLEEVDKHRPEHLQFLDRYYAAGKFICSGRRNPVTGGVLLVNVDSLAEAQKIVQEDPYSRHQMAEYEFIEFTPSKYDPRFAPFVEK